MERAFLVGTYVAKEKTLSEVSLEELEELGTTYGLTTLVKLPCPLREIDPATYIGKGKVEEIRDSVKEHNCDVVIFDDEISPQQQRNLEKAIGKPVIDRTELILGVFAQRAQTKEAKIQVDLARLRYQLPRLRGMWTHLHRQRSGGAGGGAVKGEGEKQIELDRRIIKHRIEQLERDLKTVKKQRDLQRKARKQSAIPTFAIVGYTNVGKSTLLKALTDADVLVEDKLFATLDPTTRKFVLPNKQPILLTDTVGFIRKIPHGLVQAFKSTLEETLEADILLHIVDVSNSQALVQAAATMEVLKELGAHKRPIITVLNKTDLIEDKLMVQKMRITYHHTVPISALKQEGFDALYEEMARELAKLRKTVHLRIPQSSYDVVSATMREGKVLSCEYEENDVLLTVDLPHALEKKVAHYVCKETD